MRRCTLRVMVRFTRYALVAFFVSAAAFAQNGPGKVPINSHEVHPDGSITFRYHNADAKEVTVGVDVYAKPLTMTLGSDGVWSVTTPVLPPEIYGYSFTVDGVGQMDPLNNNTGLQLCVPRQSSAGAG